MEHCVDRGGYPGRVLERSSSRRDPLEQLVNPSDPTEQEDALTPVAGDDVVEEPETGA